MGLEWSSLSHPLDNELRNVEVVKEKLCVYECAFFVHTSPSARNRWYGFDSLRLQQAATELIHGCDLLKPG